MLLPRRTAKKAIWTIGVGRRTRRRIGVNWRLEFGSQINTRLKAPDAIGKANFARLEPETFAKPMDFTRER